MSKAAVLRSSLERHLLIFVAAAFLCAALALPLPARAALTEPQIQSILNLLVSFGAEQNVINNVNASLRGQAAGGGTSAPSCLTLSYNLYAGLTDSSTGGEVTRLQQFLGVGSVTGYFGPMTEAAVQRWQTARGIVSSGSPDTTGYGYVGPRTREAMRAGCGTISTLPPLQHPATLTASPTSGAVPLHVTFSLSGYMAGSLQIDFGDGTIQNTDDSCLIGLDCKEPYVRSHTYTSPGTYYARLLGGSCNDTPGSGVANSCAAPTVMITAVTIPPAQSIQVTAPNGGEQWEIGQLNTITWTPYDPNAGVNSANQVTAYLERWAKEQYMTVGRIMDTGKASLHTDFNLNDHQTWAAPGEYYVYIVHNTTGAWDRSDKPFKLLPRPIDLKVNGSDGPVQLGDLNQLVNVSWVGNNVSTCQLSGLRDINFTTVQLASGEITTHIALPPAGATPLVSIQCAKYVNGNWIQVYDRVYVNVPNTYASLQVVSPNGGESIDPSKEWRIKTHIAGIKTFSLALYKNDQWLTWLFKDVSTAGQPTDFEWVHVHTPIGQIYPELMNGSPAIYKIYATGQKADGTGYVDDKSDAPFGFISITSSTTPPAPTGLSVSCRADGKEATISWGAVSGVSRYLIRFNDPSNDTSTCTNGWYCAKDTTPGSTDFWGNTTATSRTLTITPNTFYRWWVFSQNDAGNSPRSAYHTFSCTVPASGNVEQTSSQGVVLGEETARLTDAQITAVVSLLESFGAAPAAIARVKAALDGSAKPSTVAPEKAPAAALQKTLPPPARSICPHLVRALHRGVRNDHAGNDVSELQNFLAEHHGVPKEELVTGYFGPLTQRYVAQFQKEHGLPAEGFVGPLTRAKILERCKALKENVMGNKKDAAVTGQRGLAAAPACVLKASKTNVVAGESVVLSWESKHATHASMPGGGTDGPATGSITVAPTETTLFQKKVYGPGGEGTCTVTVEVEGGTNVEEIPMQVVRRPSEFALANVAAAAVAVAAIPFEILVDALTDVFLAIGL